MELKSLQPSGELARKFLLELCDAIMNSLFNPAIIDDFPSPWQEFIQALWEQNGVTVLTEARSVIDLLAPPKPASLPQSLVPAEPSILHIVPAPPRGSSHITV